MDYKREALNALQGHWKTAALTAFLAGLLGATVTSSGPSFNMNKRNSASLTDLFYQIQSPILHTILVLAGVLFILWLIFEFFFGGAASLGYAKFNLKLLDRKEAAAGDVLSEMGRFADGFCLRFLCGLYVALWTLLLIVPGIVATYKYYLAVFILAEHPEFSVSEAITESKRRMDGHKMEAFILDLSFIGWDLLMVAAVFAAVYGLVFSVFSGFRWYTVVGLVALVISVVGGAFLTAYESAARAAFYRDISFAFEQEPLSALDSNL